MINTVIIDDHTLFNNGLCFMLKESHQFEVLEQVHDSRYAYGKCFSLRPALVLLDYNMPHLNGLEVAKQIKSLPYDCKVVIISMYADHDELAQLREAGIDGYVAKTTPSDTLIESLQRILAGEQVFLTHNFDKGNSPKKNLGKRQLLTKREVQVQKLEMEHYTTEQIANALALSVYTVEAHKMSIQQKMKLMDK
ncbi:MAG: response regulator transcription factor [Spirosomataceae bacterium]